MKKTFFFLIFFIFTFYSTLYPQEKTKLTSSTFSALLARQIGPAVMSGRITCIDAVNTDPRIMYVGAAGGGVWKTITGGTLFKQVFDKYCQSIGALTIDQKKPNTIWVGTGESNMRNSVSIGDGIYRSDDGGDSWVKMGLENTQHISKIIVNPKDDNTVYAAAPGPLWSDSEDRGLYKTTDGGKTWNKILYIDEKTGCADILVDPKNPNVIYASMWQFRRKPWSFSSGGPGSGLYKSIDGGESWDRIDKDFTDGDLGRICLAMSPSDSKIIYAIAESKNPGLYVSNNGGETWKRNSATGNVTARPFYFSVLMVDPTDSKRIYRPAFSLSISDDGGESFSEASTEGGWIHSDHHALWINPNNPQNLYLGTDGGVYVSFDRGNNWLFLNNLPVSQFYHVTVDYEKPYNVYGGLQDNGSWFGPSNARGGIQGREWTAVGFGDGFSVVADLTDKNIVYWDWQGGNITRFNKATNENKDIKVYPKSGEVKLRYNWNTPIVTSYSNPGTIYTGSQFLYRSTNKGESWDKISPDLTTNDPEKQKQDESGGLSVDNSSAENHCTIFTICESPLDLNVIWVGTDDGNIQVTENGGGSWANVIKNITGLPKNTWCSSIDASKFDRNTAYASFDGHTLGDMKSYIYKTTDMGKTWKQLATPDIKGYVNKIKEDLVNQNLLFAGTVFGLYVSIDGGTEWAQYTGNVPNVEIKDIAIHPQTNDLVLASHGRGILIIDDLTMLRNISQEVLDADAVLMPSRPFYINGKVFDGSFPLEAGNFEGPNSADDAVIIYYLKDRIMTGEVKLEIYDSEGRLLSTIPGTKRKGFNRVRWNMRLKPPRVATGTRLSFGGFFGPQVPVGTYTVNLIKGDKSYKGTIEVVNDPDSPHNSDDIQFRNTTVMRVYKMQEDLAYLVEKINSVKEQANKLIESKSAGNNEKDLQILTAKLEELRKTLVMTKEGTGIIVDDKLREDLSDIYGQVAGFNGKPTESQLQRIDALEGQLIDANKKGEDIFNSDVNKLNGSLEKDGKTKINLMTREQFDKTDKTP
jgi:photosystem II stability/assembly factor-like uncharacterized protein